MFPFAPRRDLFPPIPSWNNVDNSLQPQVPQQQDMQPPVPPNNDSPLGNETSYAKYFHPRGTGDSVSDVSSVSSPNNTQEQPQDFASRMKAIYESDGGPATKAYADYLKSYPEASKPGFATRLGATLSGVAAGWRKPGEGSAVAQQILDAPRVRALNEWGNKAGVLKANAELEDKNITQKMGVLKEIDAVRRNEGKDADEKSLHDAQRKNYDSLVAERARGKVTYHENKTDGHLWSINENGDRKDLGVMDLSPQQKEDLKVSTFKNEENFRQGKRKDLFNFTNPKIQDREIAVHKANREEDVNNPLPARSTTSTGYESIDQQNKAITASAKELNIENNGKYSHLFNADGTLIDPEALKGGMFSDDKTNELKAFYELAKARAEEKLNKTRNKTQSTATTYPKVNLPTRPTSIATPNGIDSRIQRREAEGQ